MKHSNVMRTAVITIQAAMLALCLSSQAKTEPITIANDQQLQAEFGQVGHAPISSLQKRSGLRRVSAAAPAASPATSFPVAGPRLRPSMQCPVATVTFGKSFTPPM